MSTPFDINARLVIQSTNIGQVTQQLQTALNKVGAVAGQGAAANLSSRQIVNLTKKLGPLGVQFDKTRASATKFASTMKLTARQVGQATSEIEKAADAVSKLNQKLRSTNAAKVKVGTTGGNSGGGNIIQYNKKIADSVRRVTNEYEEFGRQIVITGKRFATYVVAATAFYSVASAMRDGIKEAIEFQHQMVRLSQTTGKSLGGLKSIRKEIDELSTGWGISSKDLAQVSVTLAQAGFSAKETAEALRALGKTTLSPSFENIGKTTEGAIAAMRQFNIEARDLEKILGSLNTVAAKFAVESDDIITAIQKAGGTFATLDRGLKPGEQSLREFIGIFSAVRDTTRESADTIATGMRTIFARVQSPKVIDFLKQYDIQLQNAQDGQKLFIGGLESILEISGKLKNVNTRSADFAAIVQQLGGQRQVSKTIPLFTQEAKIREAVRIANTGQNSLSENQVTAQQSLQVQFAKTRENFLKLIRDLGDTTSFKLLTQGVLGLTNAFIKFADVVKEIIPLATAFFASKAIGPLLGGITGRGGSVLTGISKELFRPGHGPPYRRSSGGIIPGYGDNDTVPAMLTPGEFVLNKKAVQKIGAGNLKRWNSGASAFSTGGGVNDNILNNVFGQGQSIKDLTSTEIRKMIRKLAKDTGVKLKDVLAPSLVKILSKEEIEGIAKDSPSGTANFAGVFSPALKLIGINKEKAHTRTIPHEFTHAVDLALGGGKQYASMTQGTTQYKLAEILKPLLAKRLNAIGGFSDKQREYFLDNREILARFSELHPSTLKNLVYSKKNLSNDEITNILASLGGQGFPGSKNNRVTGGPHHVGGSPPRKPPELPFEQPKGPYGPFRQQPPFPGNPNKGSGFHHTGGPPPNGPPPFPGPFPPNGFWGPYGPRRENFIFNRVSAQPGRRVSAGQYQTQVLRDLHRTHGLSYAVKNVGTESRQRLLNAVATQFEQKGLSPIQAWQKAITYVDKNKYSDVLVGANGQALGFNDNITNGLDTSRTNRVRQGFSGLRSGFRDLRAGFRKVNNSRFIRGVGAFGNSTAGLAALYGGTALVGQGLGSIDSNERKDRGKGIAGDILSPTLAGAAFGSAGGPWGILVGAIGGFATGLVTATKKFQQAKVNDAIEDYGKALKDATKNLKAGNNADLSKINGHDLIAQRHQAGLANTNSFLGFFYKPQVHADYEQGIRDFDKAHGPDIVKANAEYINTYLEKNADKLFANSGDTVEVQTEEVFKRLLKGDNGNISNLLSGSSAVDSGTNHFGLTKGQVGQLAWQRALNQLSEEIDLNVQKFTDLASVMETAVDATTKFDDRLNSMGDLSGLRTSYSGILGKPGGINVSGFNAAAKNTAGLFGSQGDELADAAITFNKFSRELPNILKTIKPNTSNSFGELLAGNQDFQNLGNGPFAEKIKQFIIAQAEVQKNHIGEDAQANSVELTRNLLSKFDDAAKVLDFAAKEFADQQNKFAGGLAGIASDKIAIGNQKDSITGLNLEAARARAGFSGGNVDFNALAAPFSSRQNRLAGYLAGNPTGIANKISQITEERANIADLDNPTKQQIERYHELGRASAELKQALEDLSDTSKSNAAAQERLAQIEEERSDRLGFAKNIFTAGAGEQGKIFKNIQLARFAVGGGNVSRLSAEQRQGVVSTLEGFGNTSNLFGTGKNGQQLLERILDKFGGKLPQNLEEEKQKQQQSILSNINKAIEAQKQSIGLAEEETKTKLDLIRETFDTFVQKLKELAPIAGNAQGFASGGSIFSPRGTDTVPAMLTPGEFVMRKEAVDRIGVSQLQSMNKGYARGGIVYAAGGGLFDNSHVAPQMSDEKIKQRRREIYQRQAEEDKKEAYLARLREGDRARTLLGVEESRREKLRERRAEERAQRRSNFLQSFQTTPEDIKPFGVSPNKPQTLSSFRQNYLKENPNAKRHQIIKAFRTSNTNNVAILKSPNQSSYDSSLTVVAQERVAANRARRIAAKEGSQGAASQIVAARQAAREQKSAANAEKINQRIAELKAAEEAKKSQKVAHFATGGVVGGPSASPSASPSESPQIVQLSKAIQELSNSPLVEALKNFPHEISLKAEHKVEVIFNGAEILTKLMPEIQQIAVDEAKKALRKMLRDKFPEAGTNV